MLAYRMFERWRQENFFKYLRDEFALDALVDYKAEAEEAGRTIPNPQRRKLDKKLSRARAELKEVQALYGEAAVANAERKRPTINGVVTRDILTKLWTDWVDYWAVDFDYQSRKEIIKVAKKLGVEDELPGTAVAGEELLEFEERWTGAYIFENEWQSFRTRKDRKDRKLELTSVAHTYAKPGRYTVAVKV